MVTLPVTRIGAGTPAFVFLHSFGGSSRQWSEITAILAPHHECVSMDIPGFGDAAAIIGYTVREMTQQIAETISSLHLGDFILVGHSLSGKLALILASEQIAHLHGLILVSPSPPTPEPIPEENRKKMLNFGRNRADAEVFLDAITWQPLLGAVRELAIDDFIRCSPAAWLAWLESGSKEDRSSLLGILDCPTLVVTGKADSSLDARAQRTLTFPHLRRGRLEVIAECGHLAPIEAPKALARLVSKFAQEGLR